MSLKNENPAPIKPAYNFGAINEPVVLSEEPAEVQLDGTTYSGNGVAKLRFLPNPGVRIHINFQAGHTLLPTLNQQETVYLPERNLTVPGISVESKLSLPDGASSLVWSINPEPLIVRGDGNMSLAYIIFHLVNFPAYRGVTRDSEKIDSVYYAIEHVHFEWDCWKMRLQSLPTTRKNIEALHAEGGYGLTHIGCMTKNDNTEFTVKDSMEIMRGLSHFFSFIRGFWCEAILCTGYDKSGTLLWELWNSPRDSWRTVDSWFSSHHADQMVELFPGFMAKWSTAGWCDALHEAIYWYLNSNDATRGIDAGIILTQTAIERLSFEYAVNEKRLIGYKGFKDLWASDKLRLLFSSIGIPIDIPGDVTELQQFKWLDAPHALTEIRNSLIHPEHKQRGKFRQATYDTWRLGLWYLELVILRLCGYQGSYQNRLKVKWTGEVEKVPWSKS